MTKKTFAEFITRLAEYYGKAELDAWARDQYYEACFCVFDKKAKNFYSDLVGNLKFFPRVSEFRECAQRQIETKAKQTNTERCWICMDEGSVSYYKKGMQPFPDWEYEHKARCLCNAGRNFPDWPLITAVTSTEEAEYLAEQNYARYGKVTPEHGNRAREKVTSFVRGWGRA
jgi:hypothetical protein